MSSKRGTAILVSGILACLVLCLGTDRARAAGKPGGGGVPNPVNLRVSIATEFSVKLEWASPSSSVVDYKVAYSVRPAVPDIASAQSVGKVTSCWVADIAPGTAYNFKVWSVDRKGNKSTGVMVPGDTLALPGNCLAYQRDDAHTLSHATFDGVNQRVYATGSIDAAGGGNGWYLAARNPSDFQPVGGFGDSEGVIKTHDYGYPICVTADLAGNVYMGGVGSGDGGATSGFMIQRVNSSGSEDWAYTPGYLGYECTEVFLHREQVEGGTEKDFVYALGFSALGSAPLVVDKVDAETGAGAAGFPVFTSSGTVGGGGNFQNMALGSDGIYIAWDDDLLGGVVTKYGFAGQNLGQTYTGTVFPTDIPHSIATGWWAGREWVWVALRYEIRCYPTDLSGSGTVVMDNTAAPFLDYVRCMQIVDDPESGDAELYACGKVFWTYNLGDAFVYRFGLNATTGAVTTEKEHVFDWGPSDSFSSVFIGDSAEEVFVSGPAGNFADRMPPQFTVLFKFSSQ